MSNDATPDDKELAALRRAMAEKDELLRALQDEIDETNRGVVALYSELDAQAERLRRSEARLQAIYAQAPSGIALIGDDGRILDGNPALSALLASGDSELVGRQLSEFVPTDFAPRVDAFPSQDIGAVRADDIPLKRHDGSVAHVEWRVSPQIEPGVTLALGTDISQRVELEQRRAQWLERERVARSDAEHGARMKDDFIAVLAHELRTPLNAVLGWTQVLLKRADSPDLSRAAAAIERNCTTQARMIADLLDMSRLNLGKLVMSFERVDPLAEVTAAVDAMAPAIKQKEIDLVVEASDSYRLVRADASRLQQVIWNLLSNAIKFSSHGGRVVVALREDETGLAIRVVDAGQGISADFLPFVFDRFAQSVSPGNRHRGGLGLGLAIVKQIVDAHGGTVAVHSEGPGQGTMFEVWLPIDRTSGTGPLHGRGDADYPLRGLRVLVVDDDPDANAAVRIILSDRGASVTTAETADAAIDLITAERPDVLVSDIGMAGRDGYDLVRDVRAHEATADFAGDRLPAIALTSFTRNQDRRQALEAGFDAHCAKPLQPMLLVQEIVRLTA